MAFKWNFWVADSASGRLARKRNTSLPQFTTSELYFSKLLANKYIRICKKYCHFITFFHLYFLLFLHFHPHVLPEEPFQGKRWETLYLGRKERPPLPFLCGGKDSNGFPHIFTLSFQNFSQLEFLRIFLLLHYYQQQEDWSTILLVLFHCSSAGIDSQDSQVRNWPMIQKERIEVRRKRKSLEGRQEIDERIY